jgi:hypothetical protein
VTIDQSRNIHAPEDSQSDYDYIIRIIHYLDYHFRIHFMITTRDFDILFRWWEKQIPLKVILDSVRNVVKRWEIKKKRINGFSNFSYEVNKNFRLFMELNVADSGRGEKNELAEIERFMKDFPPELKPLKSDFKKITQRLSEKKSVDLNPFHEKLLLLFESDPDLALKTRFFMNNLARDLRKPEIEKTYRINYLCHRYGIPDFETFRK